MRSRRRRKRQRERQWVESSGVLSFRDTLSLDAVVGLTGHHALEFLGPPIRPREYYSAHAVAFTDAKGYRQFRLRQIARTAPHHPGLCCALMEDPDGGADGVTV